MPNQEFMNIYILNNKNKFYFYKLKNSMITKILKFKFKTCNF